MILTESMNFSSQKQKLGIIGYGGMGSALAKAQAMSGQEMFIVARGKLDQANADLGDLPNVTTYYSIGDAAQDISTAEFIIPSVKPQDMIKTVAELRPFVNPAANTITVSNAAGVTVEFFERALGLKSARSMPNTPCQLGYGMSTVYIPDYISNEKAQKIMGIFENQYVGKAHRVFDEIMVDAGTAISGSGPAYGYVLPQYISGKTGIPLPDVVAELSSLVHQAPEEWAQGSLVAGMLMKFRSNLITGAGELGFVNEWPAVHVDQVLKGSVAMLNDPNSPDIPTLISKVKSSKGTTEAALGEMLMPGTDFLDQIIPGVHAAFARGQEMGQETYNDLKQTPEFML